MTKFKTIGILGGSGPVAGAHFLDRLFFFCQKNFHSIQDVEYPPVILYSLPLAGFSERGIDDYGRVKLQFFEGLKVLERSGADIIAIACNTLHFYLNDPDLQIKVPIINMIDATNENILVSDHTTIGILASETTVANGLYADKLKKEGLLPLLVDHQSQSKINQVILHIMSGQQSDEDIQTLSEIIRSLINRGAQAIIIGCTELSVLTHFLPPDSKYYDGVDITIRKVLATCY